MDTRVADADGDYKEGEERMKLLAEWHEGHAEWTLAADTCALYPAAPPASSHARMCAAEGIRRPQCIRGSFGS